MTLRAPLFAALLFAFGPPVAGQAVIAKEALGPLVSAGWIAERADEPDLLVLDIRDAGSFAAGHVPSAVNGVYPGVMRTGDWRVLGVDELVRNFEALGVSDSATVVVAPAGEDSTEFGGASSVYWALRYLGHDAVSILDGGMTAWLSGDGLPVETDESAVSEGHLEPSPQPAIRATTEEVLAAMDDGQTLIIDARPSEQYLGESKSSLVARAGRIPGAVNLPHTEIFDGQAHRLKPADAMRELLPPGTAGGRPIIVYCNTGHWSSIVWFALSEVLGLENVRLYDGSMKAWTEDPDRPVATGAP